MTAAGEDWFIYRFEAAEAANIVFNDGAGRQTGDLRREQDGWFFDDNRWYNQNVSSLNFMVGQDRQETQPCSCP